MGKRLTRLVVAAGVLSGFIIVASCGTDDDEETTTTTTYTFSADIAPIISASCAKAGGCHEATNTSNEVYVDNKANLVARKDAVINRLNGVGAIMPQAGSGVTLSATDKKKIEDYLNQSSHD